MITRSGEARGEHMIMGYWPLEQPFFHDHKAERAERRLAGSIPTVIMGIWSLGHGAPSPKWPPRALPRRLPRLFTATVATDRDKPDGRCPASVKSGRAIPPGRHERLMIMGVAAEWIFRRADIGG